LGSHLSFEPVQNIAFIALQRKRVNTMHVTGAHAPMDFQGFVEGALRSGYRCALEIVEQP
jgi:monoamine oxidase